MGSEIDDLSFRPWVNEFAGRIPDGVARLRFLQSVAPAELVPVPLKKPRWRALQLVLPALLVAPPLSFFLLRATTHVEPAPLPRAFTRPAALSQPLALPDVWQVEQTGDSETYSNGLRINGRFAVSNHPRSYQSFPLDAASQPEHGSQPIGIVFHTTESRQIPFEEKENRALQRIGESLLTYVQHKRAYNFLIDRFGRVYRIVAESDAANHAGYSVWADEQWLYLNLNESFLGVSIEAQTQPGQVEPQMSPAQLRAAAMLTEMLRSRYRIAAANCVTHAQVSVNPSNMRIGYHTDWASSFPFTGVGLPDNYARPLPALVWFGFEADPAFEQTGGARLAAAASLSEQNLRDDAAAARMSPGAYRKALQNRYRHLLAARHPQSEEARSD